MKIKQKQTKGKRQEKKEKEAKNHNEEKESKKQGRRSRECGVMMNGISLLTHKAMAFGLQLRLTAIHIVLRFEETRRSAGQRKSNRIRLHSSFASVSAAIIDSNVNFIEASI